MQHRYLSFSGFISGLFVIYGMVGALPATFSGLFNIASAYGTLLQLASLGYLLVLCYSARNKEEFQTRIMFTMIGFAFGTFIGISFIDSGVWHGVYPPSQYYPPFFYPSGEYSYQSGCPGLAISNSTH